MCLLEPLQWYVFNASVWDCPSENISFQLQSPSPQCLKSVETMRSSSLASMYNSVNPFLSPKVMIGRITDSGKAPKLYFQVVHLFHIFFSFCFSIYLSIKINWILNCKFVLFWLSAIVVLVYSGRLDVTLGISYFLCSHKVVVYYHEITKTSVIVNTILMVYAAEFSSLCLCLLGVGGMGKRVVKHSLKMSEFYCVMSSAPPRTQEELSLLRKHCLHWFLRAAAAFFCHSLMLGPQPGPSWL